jgi:hypothetical protein
MASPLLTKVLEKLSIPSDAVENNFQTRFQIWGRRSGEAVLLECTDFPDVILSTKKFDKQVSRLMVVDTELQNIICKTCGTLSASVNSIANKYCEKCKVTLSE